ncbi:hypothetical protein BJV77DRAFT_256358 [Russula vinacea]|nr:hypothetical protein BJV77DRAFT_256358 [Russula vinacea]
MPSTQAAGAIAATFGFVAIAALITITIAVCLIGEHRDQTREKRGSVITPVMNICRLAHSNIERGACMAEPQQPCEAYLSTCQPSSGIRVVSRHEDTRRTGSRGPSGHGLDLEAQSWKPTWERRNANAEKSRPFSVELPISRRHPTRRSTGLCLYRCDRFGQVTCRLSRTCDSMISHAFTI